MFDESICLSSLNFLAKVCVFLGKLAGRGSMAVFFWRGTVFCVAVDRW